MPSLPHWLSASNAVLVLIALLISTTGVSAETPVLIETVYLEQEEAVRSVLGDGVIIESQTEAVTTQDALILSQRLARKIDPETVTFYLGLDPQTKGVQSAALIVEEIGKYYPITQIVSVYPDGSVKDVKIMVYRESIGDGVRKKRFLKQFFGKSLEKNPMAVDQDIHTITGATISSWSVTDGVRRALAYADYFVFNR